VTWLRAVVIAPLLLVGSVTTSGRAGAPAPDPWRAMPVVNLTIHFSRFSPATVIVQPGVPTTFVVHNTDPIGHELIIGDDAVQLRHELGTEAHHPPRPGEISIAGDSVGVTTFVAPASGRVPFACHVPGHFAYGMRGVLVVRSTR
jgi:uncharacterized cupredoxin-like copper-binding protein